MQDEQIRLELAAAESERAAVEKKDDLETADAAPKSAMEKEPSPSSSPSSLPSASPSLIPSTPQISAVKPTAEAPAMLMIEEEESKKKKEAVSLEYQQKEEAYIAWVKSLGMKVCAPAPLLLLLLLFPLSPLLFPLPLLLPTPPPLLPSPQENYRTALHSSSDTLNTRFDRCLAWMLVALRFNDTALFRRKIDKVDTLFASAVSSSAGGVDWERRNRLVAFRGVFAVLSRNFALAATCFGDALSTFVTPELFDMSQLVTYHVASSLLALDRPALLTKCIRHPDVVSVVRSVPHLPETLDSFYSCAYAPFIVALGALTV
jgi:hypothetical protein